MKTFIKILSSIVVLLLLTLIFAPYLFKKQINDTITHEVNKVINAEFYIGSISMSFVTDFPNASISLQDILITNKAPFQGDTLVSINTVSLETSISNLLSKKLSIDHFSISESLINLKTNKDGVSNYDVMKSDTPNETQVASKSSDSEISLHIEYYSFENINFNYLDASSQMHMTVKNFNHKGTGLFSAQDVLLKTNSSIESFNFSSESIHLIKNAKFLWDAQLNLNLENLKMEFLENHAQFNDLKLSFHGFLQPVDSGIEMDLNFDSKGSQFKSLLSLVPSAYSSSFDAIEAVGALNFEGQATGVYSDTTVPKFGINLTTNNASFHYPDLPKSITDIYIDTHITNKTGLIDDTHISVNKFDLKIDKDIFKAKCNLSNLTSNPHVKAELDGTLNLNNLSQAYPVDLEEKLEGITTFHLKSEFTQEAIEKELYATIKNSGYISLKDLTIETEMLPNPIAISNARLNFTPKEFILENFEATTAQSDLKASGSLQHLMGFVFNNKPLQGNFTVTSDTFNVFDFLSETEVPEEAEKEEETKVTTDELEAIKIPANIDITTKLYAKNVSYDNIKLSQMKGGIKIYDQKAIFTNTTAKMLGGTIALKGKVDTKPSPSTFDFSMTLKELDIVESFSTLELFSSIAPFAKAFNGKMSTSLDLTGKLDAEFFPYMNSLNGDGLSKLQVKEIDPKKSNALSLLENNFSFVDLKKLDMKKIQTAIKFENSAISFKPFKIASYDGIPIQLEGSHTFSNTMDYNITTEVPVKFLGKEATNLLSGLSKEEVEKMTVPMKIKMNGDVSKPNVVPDFTSALKVVSGKVIESQKNKLIDNLFQKTNKKSDSTSSKSKDIEKAAKNLLKGLF